MSEELKPCPFCPPHKSQPEVYRDEFGVGLKPSKRVECMNCGTQAPLRLWNTRADLVPQWQPIETAPKDGTDVLVVSCEGVEVAWLSDRGEWLSNGGKDVYAEPTHWMSPPAPPNECKPD